METQNFNAQPQGTRARGFLFKRTILAMKGEIFWRTPKDQVDS